MGWPKRIRRLFKGIYVSICVCGVAIVAYSATYGAYHQPDADPASPSTEHLALDTPEGRKCVDRFHTLYGALEKRAHELLDDPTSPDAESAWRNWTQDWRKELESADSACAVAGDPSMAPLAAISKDLARLEVAYGTAISGFRQAGHEPNRRIGAAFDRLRGPRK